MTTVTLSPKYQVVIPLDVQRCLKLEPGAKMRAVMCPLWVGNAST